MKTTRNLWRKSLMVSSIALVSLFAFSSCDKDDDDVDTGATYTVSGNGSGSQVVPAVSGTGTSTFTGTYNTNTRVLSYNSTWTGLTDAPTSAGFYTGASGVAGTQVGTPWTLGMGLTGTGTVSGTMTLTAQQQDDLLDGEWYYTYGTAANPSGEVRGQISAVRQ